VATAALQALAALCGCSLTLPDPCCMLLCLQGSPPSPPARAEPFMQRTCQVHKCMFRKQGRPPAADPPHARQPALSFFLSFLAQS
jgi:hypothetical protein